MAKFCVINQTETKVSNSIRRTFFDTEEKATAYAKEIVRRNINKPPTMLVCEIKQVVRAGGPPIEVFTPDEMVTGVNTFFDENDDI